MCGILAVIGSSEDPVELRAKVLVQSKKLRHRGPDWSGIHVQHSCREGRERMNVLAHERLAIVAPEEGAQPLLSEDGRIALSVNGEIYNHQALRSRLEPAHKFATRSDCEVILHLYQDQGADFIDELDGVFAFVLAEEGTGNFLAARDPIGVVPLYWGWGADGSVWFASEMKALAEVCQRFEPFPPGHLFDGQRLRRYYDPAWRQSQHVPSADCKAEELRQVFEEAVVKRLMSDVPYGVLLSGGLDSSLVSSIVARNADMRVEDQGRTPAWWPRLHSFVIGLEGAPDLAHSKRVADFLGTAHHEFHFTVQEGLDALRDVIYHTETFDITTVRASTPMYLMARKIKALGVKMVFTGEGADEILAGYLYFHKAPNAGELHQETLRKLFALHLYDCLRANKSMSAWGVEARVPFLDKAFLDLVMNLDPKQKLPALPDRMEKHLLRSAFDNADDPFLPQDVLWRQKEQFSDGVGYGWIDSLKAHAEEQISDDMFNTREYRFPRNPPLTKEGTLYRMIFDDLFPHPSAADCVSAEPSVACSTAAALRWENAWKDNADPSGRAVDSHAEAYRRS